MQQSTACQFDTNEYGSHYNKHSEIYSHRPVIGLAGLYLNWL